MRPFISMQWSTCVFPQPNSSPSACTVIPELLSAFLMTSIFFCKERWHLHLLELEPEAIMVSYKIFSGSRYVYRTAMCLISLSSAESIDGFSTSLSVAEVWEIWTPNHVLLLKQEPDNAKDHHAVAVIKDGPLSVNWEGKFYSNWLHGCACSLSCLLAGIERCMSVAYIEVTIIHHLYGEVNWCISSLSVRR